MRGVSVKGKPLSLGERGRGEGEVLAVMEKFAFSERPLAGGCPAASYFLLLRQKKVTKEKATLLRHPYGAGLD